MDTPPRPITRHQVRSHINLAIGQLAMAYRDFEHTEVLRDKRWQRGCERILHALDEAADALDGGKALVDADRLAHPPRKRPA